MKLYRIVKKKHVDDAFTGYGAREYGGRWNSPGVEVVYAADSSSLALLEILVHTAGEDLEEYYALLEIDVPDRLISRMEREALPTRWNSPAPNEASQRSGDDWIASSDDVALLVPSAVNPHGWSALINPNHEEWPAIEAACARLDDLAPDSRLKK